MSKGVCTMHIWKGLASTICRDLLQIMSADGCISCLLHKINADNSETQKGKHLGWAHWKGTLEWLVRTRMCSQRVSLEAEWTHGAPSLHTLHPPTQLKRTGENSEGSHVPGKLWGNWRSHALAASVRGAPTLVAEHVCGVKGLPTLALQLLPGVYPLESHVKERWTQHNTQQLTPRGGPA